MSPISDVSTIQEFVRTCSHAQSLLNELIQHVISVVRNFFYDCYCTVSDGFQFALKKSFTSITLSLLDCTLPNGQYQKKIQLLRKELTCLTQGTKVGEVARVLAEQLTQYLKTYINAANRMDQALCPSWVQTLLDEHADFTLTGELVCSFINARTKCVSDVLEVNFLKMFHKLVMRMDEIQKANPYATLDFLQNACKKLSTHFDAPALLPLNMNNASQDLLALLTPGAEKEIELPGPSFIIGHLQEKVWASLQSTMAPHLLSQFMPLLDDQLTRDHLLIQGFELVKHLVNEEQIDSSQAQKKTTHYPRQDDLNKAIGSFVCSFLHYIDPVTKRRILKHMPKEDLGALLGNALTEMILQKHPLELVTLASGFIVPLINSTGKWSEDGTTFLIGPSSFPTKKEEFEKLQREHETYKRETRKQLETLIAEIGNDPKGVRHMAHKQFIPESPRSSSMNSNVAWSALEFIQSPFIALHRNAASSLIFISVRIIGRKIQELSKEIFIKMQCPKHSLLCAGLAIDAIQFMCVGSEKRE